MNMPPIRYLLLRISLLGNANFSLLCGLILMIAPQGVGAWLGFAQPGQLAGVSMALGIGLLAFGGALIVLATRSRPPLSWVRAVIAADGFWVLGSAALVLTPWADAMGRRGVWTVILVAGMVSIWGILQWLGVRGMDVGSEPAEVHP